MTNVIHVDDDDSSGTRRQQYLLAVRSRGKHFRHGNSRATQGQRKEVCQWHVQHFMSFSTFTSALGVGLSNCSGCTPRAMAAVEFADFSSVLRTSIQMVLPNSVPSWLFWRVKLE